MAFNKARMYGEMATGNAEVKSTGKQGATPGSPARFDGRANKQAGTDLGKGRGRSFDENPSIVHWTKTS